MKSVAPEPKSTEDAKEPQSSKSHRDTIDNNLANSILGVGSWLYGLLSILLVLTDIFRSSWIIAEVIGWWLPTSAIYHKLSGATLGPVHVDALASIRFISEKNESQVLYRTLFSGKIYDRDYNYYHKYQPDDEWGKDYMLDFFHEYLFDENGTLFEDVALENNSFHTSNYYQSYQVVSRSLSNKVTSFFLDTSSLESTTTDYTNPEIPINHRTQGQFWCFSKASGSNYVELYEMEFYELNGTVTSNTTGEENLLVSEHILIELQPIHFIADSLRIFAYVTVFSLVFQYVKCGCLTSWKIYKGTPYSIYDIITGNRMVSLLMGVAFFMDLEVTLNIIRNCTWYVLYSYNNIFYIYLVLVYGFRYFWALNMFSSLYGLAIGDPWLEYILYPISMAGLQRPFKYAASLVASLLCGFLLLRTERVSDFYEPEHFTKEEVLELGGEDYDFYDKDFSNSSYCIVVTVAVAFATTLLQLIWEHGVYTSRGHLAPSKTDHFRKLMKEGVLNATPSNFQSMLTRRSKVHSNQQNPLVDLDELNKDSILGTLGKSRASLSVMIGAKAWKEEEKPKNTSEDVK